MQLIWVAGPTARVVTLAVTARTIAAALGGLCALMVALGFVFHFIGLRIAVEVAPAVAHAIGGVASLADHERLEARYREEIKTLNDKLGNALSHVHELETARQDLLSLLGVRHSGIPRQPSAVRSPQGGVLRLLSFLDPSQPSLDEQLQATALGIAHAESSLQDMRQRWHQDSERLRSLPTALPLREGFYLSSGFGVRPDPITGQAAHHEGVDFVAAIGTPVRATGKGTVKRSEYLADHGQLIEVAHAEGYVSRYSHLSRRVVAAGDAVERGQIIGHLGNSGRSTGPHLHYEVAVNGRLVDPNRALAPLAWR